MKKFGYKIIDFLEDYGWQIGMSLVVLGLGVLKLFFTDESSDRIITSVILLIAAYAFFQYKTLKGKKRQTTLEEQLQFYKEENANLKESVNRWRNGLDDFFRNSLIFLYNSFDFNERDRVSIYKHEEDQFVLMGRYSRNPKLNEKGRDAYPDNEGFIAEGWRNGSLCMVIQANPENNFDAYAEEVMRYCNIRKGTLSNISMWSRSYCINDIKAPVTQEKIGVIVLESLEYDRFGGDDANHASARINELFNAYLMCKNNC